MVTGNQIARGAVKAYKAAEREQKRQAKENAKLQAQAEAADTVLNYENYLNAIISIHKNATDKIDWQLILNDQEPQKALKKSVNQDIAQSVLDDFTPNFIQKLFGFKKLTAELNKKITEAIKQDEDDYITAKELYDDWLKTQSIAKEVIAMNPKGYEDAINYFEPFADIEELGSEVQINYQKESAEIHLNVNGSDVIPNYVSSLTSTGKLSTRDMPKARFNELYQDYVCGMILRVGRETLSYLPIKSVTVHAMEMMINSTTGHEENTPIVSVVLTPEAMSKLNFDTLDASDSMVNFEHNMKFVKSKGFNAVDKVNI